MTTIAYIGNFSKHWTTETHVARDAEKIGCSVRRIEEQDIARGTSDAAHRLLDADVVLYTKTNGLPPGFEIVWAMLEARGIRTASYHLDLYRGLARGSEILDDPFWRTGTVFTVDGDPTSQAEFELAGINHRWLPAACVSDETIKVEALSADPYEPQIVFVGSTHSYHPEYPWRLQMLDELRLRYGRNFGTFGPPDRIVRGLDLNHLYQTPGRIVVGDTLLLPGHVRYWSDRYYETLGRGGFLIAPRVPGLEEHFADGEHFVGFDIGDFDGLFGAIDGYLDAPGRARAIADAGQAHVAAHHTYQHRVRTMLAELGIVP